ncbi:MAG TPA: methionyl-tRNA formyltransferase [Candidatus Dormibacteraeota bacterium]|nr:methionyl-tRNA formyltransferase [Candidatus Dormibacteraeota bacterium]
MRVVFAGSAEFSLPILMALEGSSHEVGLVLTAPDRAGSRGAAAPRPVRYEAESSGLAVEQPTRLTEEFWRDSVLSRNPQALVVAAYGQLVPEAILDSLTYGGIGVHPSLLPRHRGAAPVAAAILAGDGRTGVTVFRMNQRMDAGPILAQQPLPIPASVSRPDLTATLALVGAEMLVQALDRLEAGDRSDIPQLDSGATYSHRLSRRDGNLEWSLSSTEIDRALRALTPWPGVTVPLEGTRVKLLRGAPGPGLEEVAATTAMGTVLEQGPDWILVQAARGTFRVELVQPPGRPPMTPAAFLRGRQRTAGGRRHA